MYIPIIVDNSLLPVHFIFMFILLYITIINILFTRTIYLSLLSLLPICSCLVISRSFFKVSILDIVLTYLIAFFKFYSFKKYQQKDASNKISSYSIHYAHTYDCMWTSMVIESVQGHIHVFRLMKI